MTRNIIAHEGSIPTQADAVRKQKDEVRKAGWVSAQYCESRFWSRNLRLY